MRGDLLLFETDGTFSANLIAKFTKGPYVHVAVDLGDGTEIAAHPKGVSRQPIYLNSGFMETVSLGAKANPDCLNEAMDWLYSQVGKPYGWIDIIDSALGILGLPIYFFEKNHHDCSTLAALFVNRLYIPDTSFDNPDLVSPNDIARFFHLI